jgi:hypothetical protein
MANTVYTVEEYELQDGSLVTLKPANIAVSRKGHEMIGKLGDRPEPVEGEEPEEYDDIHQLLDIVCLCLKRQRPEFETTDDKGKKVTNYEVMEDLFDLDTAFKVIEVYLGVKLNDPKLLEAAMQLAMATEEVEKANASQT